MDPFHQSVWKRYSRMVKEELKAINALDQRFLLHPVMQNYTCHGLLMDQGLMYARKKGDTQIYLIGDSANSYPPMHSLEKGLEDVFEIIPAFCETYMKGNLLEHKKVLSIDEVFDCTSGDAVTFDRLYEPCLDEFLWKGGYPSSSNSDNRRERTFLELIRNAPLDPCKERDQFITSYNIYIFSK